LAITNTPCSAVSLR